MNKPKTGKARMRDVLQEEANKLYNAFRVAQIDVTFLDGSVEMFVPHIPSMHTILKKPKRKEKTYDAT